MIGSSTRRALPANSDDVRERPAHPRFVRIAGWRVAGRWEALKICLDLVALIVAAILSQTLGPVQGHSLGPIGIAGFVAFSLVVLAATGSYRPSRHTSVLDRMAPCVGVTAFSTMMLGLVVGGVSGEFPSMPAATRLWVLSAVCLFAGQAGLALAQNHLYRSGRGQAPTLIVGAGRVGRLAAKRLQEAPTLGLRPVGFLDKDPLAFETVVSDGDAMNLPVLGASWDLERVVQRHGVEHVVLAYSSAPHGVLLDIVHRCERLGLRVTVVPRLFERMPSHVVVTHVGGLPLLELQPVNPRSAQYALKYALDRVGAAVALVFLLPFLGVVTLIVLASLGRPILYRQRRVGVDGGEFDLLKFRSMFLATEQVLEFSETTAPGGVEGEDRRSSAGKFLRRWSLDELPQLVNILKGEMSFVGPRPERPEYVAFFEEHVFRYGERQRIKGGLTGWAQIHGLRGQSSIADRVEWDNYYIENFSLWLDLKIILRTIAVVLRGGAS